MELHFISIIFFVSLVQATDLPCKDVDTLKSYNVREEICCGGKTYASRNEAGQSMACCGDREKPVLYVKDSQTCCGFNLVDNSKLHEIYREPFCCHNEFHEGFNTSNDCCSSDSQEVIYNQRNQLCCEGVIVDKTYKGRPTQMLECCGKAGFNKHEQQCFPDGRVVDKRKKPVCGDTEYDEQKFECCRKTKKLLPKPERKPSEAPLTYFCNDDKLYDTINYELIDGVVVPRPFKPCGTELYVTNPAPGYQNICCGQRVTTFLTDANYFPQCCGNETYNTITQVCCSGRILPPGQDCCNGTSFITGSQGCCNNIIINRQTSLCCGSGSYQKRVQKAARNHTSCCGINHTYNNLDKICVDGEIRNAVSKKDLVDKLRNGSNIDPSGNATRSKDIQTGSIYNSVREVNGTEVLKKPTCPDSFCNMSAVTTDVPCSKRYDIRIFIYRSKPRAYRIKLSAVVVDGPKSGRKILLVMLNKCRCLRLHRTYHLYTNRNIRKNKIRISEKDFLIREPSSISCKLLKQRKTQQHRRRHKG